MVSAMHSSILARTSKLAVDRELEDVQRFIDILPDGADRTVQLLGAAGVDLEGLRRWITDQDPRIPIRQGRLESVGSDEAAALLTNRVVAVLQCGQLLLPEAVEAAATVVARPPGTFAVVLVGAEMVASTADLEVVQRGIWRVLLGEPDVEWAGQNLAELGCLLWSETDGPEIAGERVAADMRLLRDWVRGDILASEQLAEARVRHALDLAERELARRVVPEPPTASGAPGDVRALRAAAADLRVRLLRRLDADLSVMELQLTASLEMLEQDLVRGVGEHLARSPEPMTGLALTAAVSAYLSEGGRNWRTGAVDLVKARLRRTSDETRDLLDGVDWALVSAVVGQTEGAGYPAVILDRLSLRVPVSVPPPDSLAGPSPPAAPDRPWVPTLRQAAYGCAAAAASLVVLGPVLLPAVAAGALGAAGGAMADIRLSGGRDQRAALSYAHEAIAATMSEFAHTVREQIRRSTEPIRRAVVAEFAILDTTLGAAAERSASGAPAATGKTGKTSWGADSALLARLRADLSARPSVADQGRK